MRFECRRSLCTVFEYDVSGLGFDFVVIAAFDQDHGREVVVTLCPPKQVWNVGVSLSVPTTSLPMA
jgi:hypothetical protein